MSRRKTYFNWSSGKDSALALSYLLGDDNYDVKYLLTSVNSHYDRVSMHGLRSELLKRQVESIGLPNGTVELPEQPPHEIYERLMLEKVADLKKSGFEYGAFGDIFLDDLKIYRELQLSRLNIHAVFPLWKRDTLELLEEFIAAGFKAITVCVNADLLDRSFAGREVNKDFIKSLPGNVDPCGENGEFHTFCYDGPIFKNPISFSVGETVMKEYLSDATYRFWFCDLLPKD